MATIKSYTDLSQSRKLAEILPLESADMYYFLDPTPVGNIYIPTLIIIEKHLKSRMPEYDKGDIPCWSLASLLNVLPYCPDLSKHTDGKWYITTYPNDVHTCLMAYDNHIDGCYEMIIRLNELKML